MSEKCREAQRKVVELEEEVNRIKDARGYHIREAEKYKKMKEKWRWRLRTEKEGAKELEKESESQEVETEEWVVLKQLEYEEKEDEEAQEQVESAEKRIEEENIEENGSEENRSGGRHEVLKMKVLFPAKSFDSAVHRRIAITLVDLFMSWGMKKTEAYLRSSDAVGVSLQTLFRWKASYSASGVISGKRHGGGKHIPLLECEDLANEARKWCRKRARDGFTALDFLNGFLATKDQTSSISNIQTAHSYLHHLGFQYSVQRPGRYSSRQK